MHFTPVLFLSLTLLLTALALAREIRLRRALEQALGLVASEVPTSEMYLQASDAVVLPLHYNTLTK